MWTFIQDEILGMKWLSRQYKAEENGLFSSA